MGQGSEQKKRTSNVLDVLLGRKKPSVLKKEKNPEISLSDEDENNNTKDVKPPKSKLLHTVREHPPKKVKDPFKTDSNTSGVGKTLDANDVSEPLPTDGRAFIDEYCGVSNILHKPTKIMPSNYTGPRVFRKVHIPIERERLRQVKEKERKERLERVSREAEIKAKELSSEIKQRLQKELMNMAKDHQPEIVMNPETLEGNHLELWKMELKGPKGTTYFGDRYALEFHFDRSYPKDPPKVIFVGTPIPEHPNVTKEGHIDIPTLGKDWNSTFSVRTICSSLISMLLSDTDE